MIKGISSQEAALKAKELRWFKASQALCPSFPPGEPEQPPAPAPDIRFQDLEIGIEITEYLPKEEGGSKRRELENLRDRIVNEARQEFETKKQ